MANPETTVETRALPVQRRELMVSPGTFNAENRTVDVTFTTGARRRMFDWNRWDYVDEELSLDAGAVRLDRINNGGPVLDTHDSCELESVIGVVVSGSARIEGGVGIATLQLSRREDIAGIVQDIADGIIRNISVGYMVHEYQVTERPGEIPLMRAVDWEPAEISFVPIPADAGATVRSADPAQGGNPCIIRRSAANLEANMPELNEPAATPPVAAPAAAPAPAPAVRGADTITVTRLLARLDQVSLVQSARDEIIALHDANPLTERDLNAEIGARFAQRDTAPPQRQNVQIVRDETETQREGMAQALLHRLSNGRSELTDLGRNYRGLSLVEIGRDALAARGVGGTRHMTPAMIAERAFGMGTTDLPNIFANVLNKRLRMQYEENTPTYKRWAKRGANLRDFKPAAVIQLSNIPDLLQVNEGGEIRYGALSDGRINYSLLTYGRQLALSRQMIINDDLASFDRIAVGFANAASRLENRTAYAVLTGSNTYNGGALFQNVGSGNANQAASGAVISVATLTAARAAMRVQKGLQAEELNLTPSYLIVPAAQEQLAYQFTSSQYVPATSATINEFRNGGRTAVEPIVDAVLDAVSTTAWFLAADSNQIDTIEYAYLDGFEGVQVSSEIKTGVDGMVFTGILDFAAAAIDYRGFFRNPGV